ncbi:MAG: cytochrome c biogenesis protein CcdA [Flavobacteriales bacterium]|tara:strand:+ start:277 stop:2247 length:1971 start_codon:yes stop_codon:yes gene_type:complete
MKIKVMLFLFWCIVANAQLEKEPVFWEIQLEQTNNRQYTLVFKAVIETNWHLYSQFSNKNGAFPTEFIFNPKGYKRIGEVKESNSITDYDKVFEMDLTYFNDTATFRQEIELEDKDLSNLSVEVNYQVCDDKLCVFRTETFVFSFDGKEVENSLNTDARSQVLSKALKLDLKETQFLETELTNETSKSIWNIFFLGFIGGLLALLTPCVFPMIPLTVSFFLKQAATKSKGVYNALLYTFFIILIYGLLSLPFHFLDSINPEILNTIATNVTLNMIFFGVFVFFAFSFFGFYELTLPTQWGSKSDQASDFKGGVGIFFMALTLAIVSFSCTGPILGSLLAGSLTANGGAMQLSTGMLGFGFALGLPFGLFALFPNTLKAMPKSGGWMTTVKVVLGFLELALALKFLSNADLVAHWDLLKREVFIGIWALISSLLTLYLFGIFRFKDEVKQKIGIIRVVFAVMSLSFTAFLIYGLFSDENQLKILSGFPPPEFYSISSMDSDCPLGLECYKDYEKGLEVAITKNKIILLDFTGWACVNCRKMEENVWSDPAVYSLLNENYIIISLYVDDRKELDKDAQFNYQYSDGRIKKINTVGKKWATFQAINFQTASQPFYVQMTSDGNLLNSPKQYTDVATFRAWLEKGLKNNYPSPKAQFFTF